MAKEMIVEIPKGSSYKYEVDKTTGILRLDRVLNQTIPFNYGYIPHSLANDGDPTDVCLISDHTIPPLTLVEIEISGVFKCKDNGIQDDKIVAYIKGDNPEYSDSLTSIKNYLKTYKTGFVVESFESKKVALEIINKDMLPKYI